MRASPPWPPRSIRWPGSRSGTRSSCTRRDDRPRDGRELCGLVRTARADVQRTHHPASTRGPGERVPIMPRSREEHRQPSSSATSEPRGRAPAPVSAGWSTRPADEEETRVFRLIRRHVTPSVRRVGINGLGQFGQRRQAVRGLGRPRPRRAFGVITITFARSGSCPHFAYSLGIVRCIANAMGDGPRQSDRWAAPGEVG
jgi:hypothetical protein